MSNLEDKIQKLIAASENNGVQITTYGEGDERPTTIHIFQPGHGLVAYNGPDLDSTLRRALADNEDPAAPSAARATNPRRMT